MTLPATDIFTDTNGTTITAHNANWSVVTGGLNIQSNAYAGTVANNNSARWTGDTFSNDQYSQVTNVVTDGNDIGIVVRAGSSGVNYYLWSGWSTGSNLGKMVTGTWTQIGSNGASVSAGDVLRLEVSGTTLTPKKNGSLVSPPGTQTDTSHTSGAAGIYAWFYPAAARGDNWEGGNLGAAAYVETGGAVSIGTSSGADLLDAVDTGAGVSDAQGSAADLNDQVDTGGAVAVASGSGADVYTPAARAAYPTSDTSLGTWSNPTWSVIDDESDTDYSTSGNVRSADDVFKDKIASLTDPLSSTSHIITVRAKYTTNNSRVGQIKVELLEGTTVRATLALTTLTTSFAAYTYTLSGAEADSITDYTNLSLMVTGHMLAGGSGTSCTVQVSSLKLNVPSAAPVYIETGGAVSSLLGSGTDVSYQVDTGASVSDLQGSGADLAAWVDAGAAVSDLQASGADVYTPPGTVYTETGGAVTDAQGSGADLAAWLTIGGAISISWASGADLFGAIDAGKAVGISSASGADLLGAVDTGGTVSDLQGSGAELLAALDAGGAVSDLQGAGADLATWLDAGGAVSVSSASGADLAGWLDAGVAVSDLQGSGADTYTPAAPGTVYTETGGGVSALQASGVDLAAFLDGGGSVSISTATGGDLAAWLDAGAGISIFAGTGSDLAAWIDSGAGISILLASGLDISAGTTAPVELHLTKRSLELSLADRPFEISLSGRALELSLASREADLNIRPRIFDLTLEER